MSTEPIDITSRTTDLQATVGLALPPEVRVVGAEQVTVRVTISEILGTRTFSAGVDLVGERSDLVYLPDATQVGVSLGGPVARLDTVDAAQLLVGLQVTDLGPGDHLIPVTFTPPTGLELLSLSPAEVMVRIEEPPPPDEGLTESIGSAGGSLAERL